MPLKQTRDISEPPYVLCSVQGWDVRQSVRGGGGEKQIGAEPG